MWRSKLSLDDSIMASGIEGEVTKVPIAIVLRQGNCGCLASNVDNISMLDSLQVKNGSRCPMSQNGGFRLAEQVFADNPMFRSGTGDGFDGTLR